MQKHVILDVDGVLVDGYVVRPGLAQLLNFLFTDPRIATVSVWTASMGWWAEIFPTLIAPLMPPGKRFHFVWQRNKCRAAYCSVLNEICYVKPLARVWRRFSRDGMTRHNTLILDDTPYTWECNYGNALRVQEFSARVQPIGGDVECAKLVNLLNDHWLSAPDVRHCTRKSTTSV